MDGKPTRRAWWKRLLLALFILAAVLSLAILGVLLLFEWRPDALMDTQVHGPSDKPRPPSDLALMSWNIGYAGLGEDADFFMDGGAQVRPPDEGVVRTNLEAVCGYLAGNRADVVLLQEVDSHASRTFGIDQVQAVTSSLPDHFWARAINFKVPWIPYPLLRPIGRVESGLVTLSRYQPETAVRHQLPGEYGWPVRVFHLKRCLHEVRFKAPDGKDWIILHLHLSAFDAGGALRKQQMTYLKELLVRFQSEGHHVIVGGDFNQAFPGLHEASFSHKARTPQWFQKAPPDWAPDGFRWAFDDKTPSLRATNQPYIPGENFVTTVDGFLVGPGIEIGSVQTRDLGFVHSDHQPVLLKVSLPETATETGG